jgi:tetratricopeptide (TPR) repeat protein
MQNTQLPGEDAALYDPTIPKARALIGREQDLTHIKQRLYAGGDAALTVLHGLPGVGKTALATVLAHDPEIRAHFSGGVLWAGLGPNPNIPGLLSHWAGLWGLSATERARLSNSNTQAWASAIRNAIGSRKIIIIIDDAWQFEDVQALRVGAQDCAHLVTTRHRALAAEITPNTMMISELNQMQSVLLLNRAMQGEHGGTGQALGTGAVLGTTPTVPAIAQSTQDLVQAVGGLPLALTLLGNYLRKQAQQRDEPISAALERLSNVQLRLQISEPYTSEDHPILHSPSLQSVIAITDQWLPEPAREALYALSVFPPKPHTFTEEAALAVTASTYDELDILNDVGLLESYGARYTLHQVISDYAHIHLPETEEREASSRLIAYIADYVEAHKKDYELLDLESHTIYLALSQAHAQGKQHELIRVICAFAPFLILRGFYSLAEPHLKRAYDAAVQLNDKEGIIGTLLYLGEIEQRLGNYSQAETHLQQGLTLARQGNNQERICALLTQLGIIFQEQGNSEQAETTYQEGLTLARSIADNESICTLLCNLGRLNMRRGEFAESQRYLQEGLALARKISDRERVGELLRMLGALEIYRSNFVQAQSYLQEGLTIARSLGDSEQICALLGNLGLVAAQQGKNAQAKIHYQEGLELARQIGHREMICRVLINLGDVFIEEENYVQAELSFQEGLDLARQIGHREGISILLMNLGITTHKQGRYSDAERYLQESLHLASQIDRPRITCIALYEFGDLYLSMKKVFEAEKAFKEVIKLLPSGDQEYLALAYYGLARVYAELRDRENARLYGDKSVTIFEGMGYRKVTEVRDWMKSALGYTSETEE